jgi:hypothetical protein
MSVPIHGKYKAGVIHPDRPLNLPENADVELLVTAVKQPANGQTIVRPLAPQFTADELQARLDRHAVSVGTLPADFSRVDIYRDHD